MLAHTTADNAASMLQSTFTLARTASRTMPPLNLEERRETLATLRTLIETNEEKLIQAVSNDFGWRSRHETEFAEIGIVISAVEHCRRHLKRWMKPQKVSLPLNHWPARAKVARQPLGVVGVIGPWNYPIQLTLVPVVNAIAAGNRVLIKPSEYCPKTSALLAEMINDRFPPELMSVHLGSAAFGATFSALPFDHLFFTGSTSVGRAVATAAAQNLTPVTLELGGKSPAIVCESADLDRTADAIAWGKCLNAGQTCVAPDYVLVSRGLRDELVSRIEIAVKRRYPKWWSSGDYSAIISDKHLLRLRDLVENAQGLGTETATLGEVCPSPNNQRSDRMLQPMVLLDPPADARIMQEEIFGPLLPVISVDSVDEAITYVNSRPRPLALYLFTRRSADKRRVQQSCVAGGMLVNDTIWHVAIDDLPFGGVGESGSGAYHGENGFLTFTKQMPIYAQSVLTGTGVMRPPYGRAFEFASKVMRRFA
jgi:coniferyl-aldehyde dehydrogenase